MRSLLEFITVFLPVGYALLIWLYALLVVNREKRLIRLSALFFNVLLAVHILYTVLLALYKHYFPVTTPGELLSLSALFMAVLYWLLEKRLKVVTTGMFIFITIFFLQFLSAFLIDLSAPLDEVLQEPMFLFHVSSVVVAYSALFICTLFSIIYLILYYSLKKARFGLVYQISFSLEELSRFSYLAGVIGFVMLSVTIVTGIIWRKEAFPDLAHFDPQVVVSYLIWTIYGIFIYGKYRRSWSAKKLSYLSVGGAGAILSSLIIVNYILQSFHRFG